MTKGHIVQLVPSMDGGGVERAVIEIADIACANHYTMSVFSKKGSLIDALEATGAKHYAVAIGHKNPIIAIINIIRLYYFCKKHHVTIIHARSRMPAWVGYIVSNFVKCHFVTTFHGCYNFNNGLKKYYNSVMCKGSPIIAISRFIKNHITQYYAPKNPIITITRGVDIALFDPKKNTKEAAQYLYNKYHIPKNKKLITIVGRYSAWKGQALLIEAIALMKQQHNIHILLVGLLPRDVKQYEQYKQLVETHKLHEHFSFIPYQANEVVQFYALSDIVVSASTDPEAFGRVTIEASAMGNIVIAPKHGGAVEQIEHGKTGFLFTPSCAASLSNTIEQCLHLSEDDQQQIQKAAIKNAQHYAISNMQQATLALYNNLS